MPEYLAPAVYVEETSFRAKSIAGVGTSTAAFVGPCARGPISSGANALTPPLLTSPSDFERIYGGPDALRINGAATPNYLALAVQAFFANGGGRLYVARIAGAGAAAPASGELTPADSGVSFTARAPAGARIGASADNFRVSIAQVQVESTKAIALRKPPGTMVRVGDEYYVIGTVPMVTSAADASAFEALADGGALQLVSASVAVEDPAGVVWEGSDLGFHPLHPRYAGSILGASPPNADDAMTNPVRLDVEADTTAPVLREALCGADGAGRTVALTGGTDGNAAPTPAVYTEALNTLLALEDVSIIAAPGGAEIGSAAGINQALIASAETRRAYRIAVLETASQQSIAQVRTTKSGLDSSHAALYYPWITTSNPVAATDPLAPGRIDVPPAGAVCGIYARTDIERGVWKAPANETVTGAVGLQRHVRFGEQEVLNPLGVNCIRALPNRGIRVWGARTASSDPEWKYVPVRRYFLYLEASIDRGTQWAVFEPNGERLWDNVRTAVTDFLYSEWVSGALLGATPAEAFFVRCGRDTMTQNDIDNGRLVCLVGVAALKPAEFVIFRIGQKTAGADG
ncbi:phage tail sheath subtilisin-like domain-containing protein [uncultured Albimonas sp.]|uniref:phage tail sheath family protein n=1 Tax=uncultured Albimonas sp. TaxID=1331701 RepID=UPI0030EF82E5